MDDLQTLKDLINAGAEALGLTERPRLDDTAVFFGTLKVFETQVQTGEQEGEGSYQPVFEGCWEIHDGSVSQTVETTLGAAIKLLELYTQNVVFKAIVQKQNELERTRMLKEAAEIF